MRAGYRVWILGVPSRVPLAQQLASFFVTMAPPDLGPPAVLSLGLHTPCNLALRSEWDPYGPSVGSACKKGDLVLVLTGVPKDDLLAETVARATGRGVWTVIMTSRKAKKSWKTRADRVLNLCADSDIALMEMQLVFGHLLASFVAEKLEGSPEPVFDNDGLARDSGAHDVLAVDSVRLLPEEVSESLPLDGVQVVSQDEDMDVSREDALPTAIRFRCHSCGDLVFAEARHKGKQGRCPRCDAVFTVPNIESELVVASEVVERRSARRFAVTDCTVQFARGRYPSASSYTAEYALADLSEVGLRFVKESAVPSDCGLDEGEDLFLCVNIPAFLDPLRLKGNVQRVEGSVDRRAYAVSITFTSFEGEAREKLKRLTENQLLRDIARA